ncbi:MAG TPA: amidohydrolase [Sphingomicrobium sp.]
MLSVPLSARAAEHTTVFTHANVVPMDRDHVLADQTVVVRNGVIAAIGRDLPVPADAVVIDARGKWLSPGLADMHIHSDTADELAVYLANGITTVLNMGGARQGFLDNTVPKANRGEIAAPHVYTSWLVDGVPDYNGFLLKTPAQARAFPALAKAQGYDFIKVYVGLKPAVYAALAQAAKTAGLPLVGHGVYDVRIDRQLAQGQVMIAHLEEFFYSYLFPPPAEKGFGENLPPEKRIADAVALVKKYDATVTADPLTYRTIALLAHHPERGPPIFADPQFELLPHARRMQWLTSDYFTKTANLLPRADYDRRLVKAFADAGVRLIAGTDSPTIPGLFPGSSIDDDLDELRAAGLSTYQALATATVGPGDFIAKTKGGTPFGRVVAGARADLLLTAANPLVDLATLRKPLGVMAAGRWRDAAALEKLKDDVRSRYRAAEVKSR